MFELLDGEWNLAQHLTDFTYIVERAFGSFLVVSQPSDSTLRLLEIKRDSPEPVVTDLQLCAAGKPSKVDSCLHDQMSLLRYSQSGTRYDFRKFN